MIKKFFAAAIFATMLFFAQTAAAEENITYQANVEGLGWMQPVKDGEIVGTTGQARRMEALIIEFAGGIKYRAHVQNIGWQKWSYAGEATGTVGKNLRMEAIQIELVGRTLQYYDVYYRAHVENIGWLGWAKNGEPAGTAGASLRLEALQILLVSKEDTFETGSDKAAFYQKVVNAPKV